MVVALLLLRVVHLNADFPNHSFWSDDHAKYSDEGWYANAGMNSVLMGHWYLPGDWAPAVVVPAWPALMTVVFHVTGVSVTAARATEAVFSWIGFVLCWALYRRYNSAASTWFFVLLASASATAYVYSRLAILERPFEACILLCLWIACTIRRESWIQPVLLGASLVLLILTKTTGVFLIPAILYPVWFRYRNERRQLIRPLAIAVAVAGVLLLAERVMFARHYAAATAAFFANSEPRLQWFATARKGVRFFYRGTWIDPVLWPLACVALLSSFWLRELWRNLLWGVCALWVLGYAAFIIYHYDGPPRYFTVLLFPVFMIVAMFTAELWQKSRGLAWLVIGICAVSLTWNLWEVQKFVRHPEYSMLNATEQIRRTIDAHPESHRLIMGHAANATTLYIAIPSVDDINGEGTETQKLAMYQPGWVLVWSDEPMSDLAEVTAQRRLIPMLNVPAYDDPVRNHLLLYQVEPLAAAPQTSSR